MVVISEMNKSELTSFENCSVGRSEEEAIANAYRWEDLGYKISDLKIVKKPSLLAQLLHPLMSGNYVVDYTVHKK